MRLGRKLGTFGKIVSWVPIWPGNIRETLIIVGLLCNGGEIYVRAGFWRGFGAARGIRVPRGWAGV